MTDFERERDERGMAFLENGSGVREDFEEELPELWDFYSGWDSCADYLYPKIREALMVGSLADIEKRIGEVFGK